MKICLATLHARPTFTPLALLYLKAYLLEHGGFAGDHAPILEFTRESAHDEMVGAILATRPDVVGLSCYVWNVKQLLAVAAEVKARSPHTRIVLGGPEVGPRAAGVLRANPAVDVVVRSEGEIPFSELLAAWRSGAGIGRVRGVSYRDGRPEGLHYDRSDIVETDDPPILQELGRLPSPHIAGLIDPAGRVICLETQRGCVFRCNFCFYNKDLSIRNRRFDLERVKREILFWLRQDVAEIYLMDPIFNLNAERAKEICRFIAAHNERGIELHAEIWAEFVDEELARLMSEANFQFLEVGLQSTDRTALATVERRLRQQRFEEGVGYLRKHKLKFEIQLIYGLPGETTETFKASLNYAHALDAHLLAVFPLMVLPGTELWRKAQGLDLEYDPEPPYFVRSHFSMKRDDIEYGFEVSEASRLLGTSKTFQLLCREPGLTFAEVIDEWIAWQRDEALPDYVEPSVKQFLAQFCAKKQIAPEFYQGFASWEFRS
jgi:anaerobic magnesium-protoporphyrin IX monomethyl ester cyclase